MSAHATVQSWQSVVTLALILAFVLAVLATWRLTRNR